MMTNRKILLALCTLVLALLAGCGNETNHSNVKAEVSFNAIRESKKEEYLKKLNEMKVAEKNLEVGTTMVELNEQAAQQYKNWDAMLNEIYSELKKQLSTEQMDQLKVEQQKWINDREVVAKEASLKYQGGSMESLEYVTTLANLTRERCFELIEKYMK